MKIVFMGTPDFAVPVLSSLLQSEHTVSLVVTQPDREKGRGKKVVSSPVKEVAVENHIPVFQPEKVKEKEAVERLREEEADLFVVVAFGQLLSEEILRMPKYGCVNVHASLLPKYRGASPIQWAIAMGEEVTGITTMKMDIGMDTGDILLKEEVKIEEEETGESLFLKLSEIGGPLLLKTIEKLEDGSLQQVPQDDSEATYAPILRKEMGKIDWSEDAKTIRQKVFAFYPWPGTYTTYGGKLLKIGQAKVLEEETDKAEAGTILRTSEEGIDIACGKNVLRVTRVQQEGKKQMDAAAFLRGFHVDTQTKMGE